MASIDQDQMLQQLNGESLNLIEGTANDDYLMGLDEDDEIYGYDGNDIIISNGGNDRIFGGLGADYIYAIEGNNYVWGESGDDTIYTGIGNDVLSGGDGNDAIIDIGGVNQINGDEGDDFIYVKNGEHTIEGGAGNDTIYSFSNSTINDSAGNDRYFLIGGSRNFVQDFFGNNYVVIDNNGSNTVVLGDGNDQIDINRGNNLIYTSHGNDTVTIRGGNNYVILGDNTHQVNIENGTNTLVYVGGNDTYVATNGTNNFFIRVHLTEGNHIAITGGVGVDTLNFAIRTTDALWYQTAVNDFYHFLESNPNHETVFDFSQYDPEGLFLQLTVSGIENISAGGYIFNPSTPQNIILSNNSVDEAATENTLIGQVTSDNDIDEVPIYSLIDDYQGLFRIDANTGELFLAETGILDISNQASYIIEVRVDDGNNLWTIKEFRIDVTQSNVAPWDIELSTNRINEDAHQFQAIGRVTSQNEEHEQATYRLIEDNQGLFLIENETGILRLAKENVLDFEHQQHYQIRVEVDDGRGGVSLKDFTIYINDKNELTTTHQYKGLLNGFGQTVAVIDGSLAYDMAVFGNGLGPDKRVVGGYDFIDNDADPIYETGLDHGTWVTSIIASSGSRAIGWAPEVDIVSLRVFTNNGASANNAVLGALNFIKANQDSFKNPITTFNLSLGDNSHSNTPQSYYESILSELKELNLFAAVAAGNGFIGQTTPGLAYPASSDFVVPVAAHEKASNDLINYSQRNEDVIVARGRSVLIYDKDLSDQAGFETFGAASGTSFAAPQVAGAAIQLRELMEIVGRENVDQDMIYQHMRQTANPIYDPITDTTYLQLNMVNAVNALMPVDDYGNDALHATQLGEMSGHFSLTGFISATFNHDLENNGKVIGVNHYDIDYFNFVAGFDGELILNALSVGVSNITLSWLYDGAAVINNQSIAINVVAGNDYSLGISSLSGMGHYEIIASYTQNLFQDMNETAPDNIRLNKIYVVDNAEIGDVVSQVLSDNDQGEHANYQLLDDANGLFQINATTGEIILSHAITDPSLKNISFTVLVDDGLGLQTSETLTLSVLNSNQIINDFKYDGSLKGEGQTVAVLSTGIDHTMPLLGGGFGEGYKVVGGWDFVDNDNTPQEGQSTDGSFEASIIAGQNANYQGWAPSSSLAAVRILGDWWQMNNAWLKSGLQWVIDNANSFANPITTVFLPIYNQSYHSNIPLDIVENELATLKDMGIFLAASGGNNFVGGGGGQGVTYPAASPYVVPVGNHTQSGDEFYFASQRNEASIIANGHRVSGYRPTFGDAGEGVEHAGLSINTTVAAAQVTGAAVQIRELIEIINHESVTQDDIYQLMKLHSDELYDPSTNVNYTKLNVQKIIEAVMPEDDFANQLDEAFDLGVVEQNLSFTGFIGADFNYDAVNNFKVTGINNYDRDFFNVSVREDSIVTFSLHAIGQSSAELTWLSSELNVEDNTVLQVNLQAGEHYQLGVTSTQGIGYYEIQIDVNAPAPIVESTEALSWQAIFGSGVEENTTIESSPITPLTTQILMAENVDHVVYDVY